MTRHREEAINTQLAVLLSRYGVRADAEQIVTKGANLPDVMISVRGLRVTIEGKFEDHQNAANVVFEQAKQRVDRGIAHVAVAVVYPKSLRSVPTASLEEKLKEAMLRFRIHSEAGDTEWYEGTPSALLDSLRRAQEVLAHDDVVSAAALSLSQRLDGVAFLWIGNAGACDRLSTLLGMNIPVREDHDQAEKRRTTAARVAALVLANALIFQEQLAGTDGRITPLRKLDGTTDTVGEARKHWRWIWENINYVPIFQLGERVLEELPVDRNTNIAFRALLAEARNICGKQSALRHDLMGRIYHWLLNYAKYLGTYYTSVSAATLLLKLALGSDWKADFGDPVALANFKIADLACGTGTLMMAAAQAVSDEYIRSRADSGRSLTPVDLQTLHRAIMENILHGYDVLPSAVHLTASTLAMLAPEVAFVRMNLYVMPMGVFGKDVRLGSLDFLHGDVVQTQVSLDDTHAQSLRTGAGKALYTNAVVPKLDLCVMNPPFVRSVGGNLLFGSLPDERGVLQKELKEAVKKIEASTTAGLGSVFTALADKYLKECGRLAFVLPHALTSGEAWAETRALIARKYALEMVISSHDAERPNFSENTDLSEVLFIARKLAKGERATTTRYVNLWKVPATIHDALEVAARIQAQTQPGLLRSASGSLGETFDLPAPRAEENWYGALFARAHLAQAFASLKQGRLEWPRQAAVAIPLTRLDALGQLGFDRRDVHDAFTLIKDFPTSYRAFWDHDAKRVTSIAQEGNAWLEPRNEAAPGRPLRVADDIWAKAADIQLVERVRLNSHRVIAVGLPKTVLGNTWWALRTDLMVEQKHALLLWLNSTLGLLLVYGSRVITEGAWVQIKKPAWAAMPVLDVRKLSAQQLKNLSSAYAALARENLDAIAKLDRDPIRARIDAAIEKALGLPDLSTLREMLAREPGLTGQPLLQFSKPKTEELAVPHAGAALL